MPSNESAWELESGFIDDYDLDIEKSYFATDPRFQGGQSWLLFWEGTATTAEGDEQPHSMIMGLGAGWVSEDGGETVVHEKGKEKFNANSRYGRIIARCTKSSDPGYLGDDCKSEVQSRGGPREASIWEGLRFHMNREEIDFKGEIGVKEWELPTEFKGVAGAGQGSLPTSASTASSPVSTSVSASPANGSANNKVALARLRKLAKECDTHEEFVDKALDMPEVSADDELMAMVTDENEIYASAR